jgi:hypothetical protein
MSLTIRVVALMSIVAFVQACGGESTDGNEDPSTATCRTRAVMHCRSGSSCHEFYSDLAANAVRSTCVSLGDTVADGPCAPTYDRCCIHIDGSYDRPEGICLSPSSSVYSDLSANCDAPDPFCMR